MKKTNENIHFVANVIYKAAIDEEKEWRKTASAHDITLMDDLLKEVRKLGYPYRFFADLTNRENSEKEFWDLLLPYVCRFQDSYLSAALVGVIGKKGNVAATEMILKSYGMLSKEDKWKNAAFYDNALWKIKDKRHRMDYMELLKIPEEATKFPLTMIMLGKWRVEEAKPFFLKYLNADILYHNETISDLTYISLEALSYYEDADGAIAKAMEEKLNTKDKNLISATQKAIKRIKRAKEPKNSKT